MDFALLGNDPDALDLAYSAAVAGHNLAWIGEIATRPPWLERIATWANHKPWEALLDGQTVRFVVVGRSSQTGDEVRAEQLRKLTAAGVPLLVVHPVFPSMLVHYELEMIRNEYDGTLRHYTPGKNHPLLAEFAYMVQRGLSGDGPLEGIEQVNFDREIRDRAKSFVLSQFARDADFLASVCGELNRIGAIKGSESDSAFQNLTLNISGVAGVPVRWSVAPAYDAQSGRLSAIGRRSRAELIMPENHGSEWRLTVSRSGEPEVESRMAHHGVSAAIEQFVDAIEANLGDDGRDWNEAARSVELAEAAERSVAKGKTVELHFDEYSTEATFKGRMASWGCALLVLAVCLACLVGFMRDILKLGVSNWVWLVVLIPLLVFLLVQVLPKFFPSPDDEL